MSAIGLKIRRAGWVVRGRGIRGSNDLIDSSCHQKSELSTLEILQESY